ncbi:uncharacterized protein LOC134668763 [Cydia fagiglandana]|uniref:uncharacterized protein LOC134668763 n=1 Tax=Cydia fagiglandana TaxID=1458189 RepID=UPI002FEE09DF
MAVVVWREICCGVQYLRAKCFFIGYLNLIASTVDLGCHLIILSAVTNFFSCDVDLNILHNINWSWLEPFLVVVNIGTHGFYPFPLVLGYYDSLGVRGTPRCYPGMVHLYIIDLINIVIHVVWLRLVVTYIKALYKKDADTMRMFFSLSVIKIILQLMHFAYTPLHITLYSDTLYNSYWVLKILDICVAITFLLAMNSYIKAVRAEKAPALAQPDHPPSYDECAAVAREEKTENIP